MKNIFLIFILVLLSSCVFSQEADLQYKFRQGAKHKFTEKITEKTEISAQGKSQSALTESITEISEEVLSAGETGKVRQISEMTVFKINDSDVLPEIPEDSKKTSLIYEQNVKGKCLNLTKEDGSVLEGFDPEKETPIFSDGKVKTGSRWDWIRTVEGLKIRFECTLEKLYSENGVDIAKISMEAKEIITENSEEKAEISMTGSGVFYYAVNYGNDLYVDYNVEFETDLPAVEDGSAGSLKTVYNYTYWRNKGE